MTISVDRAVSDYPRFADGIPRVSDSAGQYVLRFAENARDLDDVLKLRFEVFNLEMCEGLDSSYSTCRDVDDFDAQCHHMIVEDRNAGAVVGTYRLQTLAMARSGRGFYSADEFDLSALEQGFLPDAVELGRACVALAHRNSRVLYLLWRGLAAYVVGNRKRYFFGCCSLTSQNPVEGRQVMDHLTSRGLVDERWHANPQPGYECYAPDFVAEAPQRRIKLPRLMRMYLDYGARIAGPPAIDTQFKTIDYLALFDMHSITPRIRRMFID